LLSNQGAVQQAATSQPDAYGPISLLRIADSSARWSACGATLSKASITTVTARSVERGDPMNTLTRAKDALTGNAQAKRALERASHASATEVFRPRVSRHFALLAVDSGDHDH
jgi:hypothetical protein